MDLLLVWRCMVIFTGFSRVALWGVMLLPCLLFLTSICLGILFLAKTSRSSPFSAVNYSLAYFSATLALNIIVTIFIVARLLACRWRFGRVLGTEYVSHYSNLAVILVESASLYSLFLIPFIVSLALHYPLAQISLQAVGQVQSVSSLLIIFRMATGRGWTGDTNAQMRAYPGPDVIRPRMLPGARFHCSASASRPSKPASHISVTVDRLNDRGDSDLHV